MDSEEKIDKLTQLVERLAVQMLIYHDGFLEMRKAFRFAFIVAGCEAGVIIALCVALLS